MNDEEFAWQYHRQDMRDARASGYEAGLRDGAARERAATLQFLRDKFGSLLCMDHGCGYPDALEEQLAAVERGEHAGP